MYLALKMREAQQWFIDHVQVLHRGYTLPCKNLRCHNCHKVQHSRNSVHDIQREERTRQLLHFLMPFEIPPWVCYIYIMFHCKILSSWKLPYLFSQCNASLQVPLMPESLPWHVTSKDEPWLYLTGKTVLPFLGILVFIYPGIQQHPGWDIW